VKMDKTEKFIKDKLSSSVEHSQLDMDAIIAGTHSSIKKRAARRKALYSSPIAILLVIVGIMMFPRDNVSSSLPGGELFMVGWEYSWTETEEFLTEDQEEQALYEQSVDYLIGENYYTYYEDADDLLDESDLEALKGYLKEA